MRTTIDKAGRLVVPRTIRESVGLAHGGEVEVEVDGAAIRIEPATHEELLEEDGFLVIPSTGASTNDATIRRLLDADRQRGLDRERGL